MRQTTASTHCRRRIKRPNSKNVEVCRAFWWKQLHNFTCVHPRIMVVLENYLAKNMSKTSKGLGLIAISKGLHHNSRSGCKYTPSFYTLTETLPTCVRELVRCVCLPNNCD